MRGNKFKTECRQISQRFFSPSLSVRVARQDGGDNKEAAVCFANAHICSTAQLLIIKFRLFSHAFSVNSWRTAPSRPCVNSTFLHGSSVAVQTSEVVFKTLADEGS